MIVVMLGLEMAAVRAETVPTVASDGGGGDGCGDGGGGEGGCEGPAVQVKQAVSEEPRVA